MEEDKKECDHMYPSPTGEPVMFCSAKDSECDDNCPEMQDCPCCGEEVLLGDDEVTEWESGDHDDMGYHYSGSGQEFECPKCKCRWMNIYSGTAQGSPEIGNPVEDIESTDMEVLEVGTIVYNSKEECELHYDIHPLYDYPVKCKRCGERVGVKQEDITREGFSNAYCNCRKIILNYACGVHQRRK